MDLHFDGLRIRNAVPADCGQLADWWNDGGVMAHAGFPNGLGTTREAVVRQLANERDGIRRTLILEYRGKPIGEMSYRSADGQAAEIGIKICEPDYQEKGLGRIALSMLVKELFSLGFSKIVLDTNLKNLRAQHVYECLGFRKLRVNVDAWTDQVGELQSSVDYELEPESFRDYAVKES